MGKNRGRKIIRLGNPTKVKRSDNDIGQIKPSTSFAKSLDGSRFRWLNESLYTESSSNSFEQFQRDPKLFDTYHSGFRSQTVSWPSNPVDECLKYIRANIADGSSIGDFGCGDAKLAQVLKDSMTMNSFDLVSTNPLVTACNIAHVPLPDKSLDMAVFSLSLMGTDWPKFIAEAQRCLKPGGIIYIAEVQSRVSNFTDFVSAFKPSFEILKSNNQKESYFVTVILKKASDKPLCLDNTQLKPCLYKKR
jgi:hypothetical protein